MKFLVMAEHGEYSSAWDRPVYVFDTAEEAEAVRDMCNAHIDLAKPKTNHVMTLDAWWNTHPDPYMRERMQRSRTWYEAKREVREYRTEEVRHATWKNGAVQA